MIKISPSPTPQKVSYDRFKGVDFSTDALLVDRHHSPNAKNLISDKDGLPQKRIGTRTLHSLEAPINGLFYGYIGNEKTIIVHGGTKLYSITDEKATVIKSDIENSRSSAFFFNKIDENQKEKSTKAPATALYILTGKEYLTYDKERVRDVKEVAFIPTILIAKTPKGGGSPLQAVNLLQPSRIEKFVGNGSDKMYQLSAKELDESEVLVTQVLATGEVKLVENTNFTVNRATGQVSFSAAPPISPINGEDNIFITYQKTVEGYAERVTKSTISTHYGLGGSNRIFLTGNKDYKAYDRWSEINNPTYFPDLNYSIVGSDNTAVVGYAKIGEYLALIKEDNSQDSTIFIRSAQSIDNKAVFPLKQGVTGTGAISPYSFVNLIDEPLFLSRTGVYAVTSNIITAERTLQNRSFYVNNRLCKEKNLENAVAVEWNGYYILSVNSNVYLLDSRQKTPSKSNSDGFYYECYFWDNIPAVCFLSFDGLLYFGTADGRVCKFNTDIETMNCFSDDDREIHAFWETKADDDGANAFLKTMQKKGGVLTIKPSVQTGANIYVSVDGEPFIKLSSKMFSLFSWENLNFLGFTFLTTETPKNMFINKKVKKYSTLQFRVENNMKNQSFGIYDLTKYSTIGNYRK